MTTKAKLEEVVRDTADKLAAITAQLGKLDTLEKIVSDIQSENRLLRDALNAKDEEILALRHSVNEIEQRSRAKKIRVLNIPLTNEEEGSSTAIAEKVYHLLLGPILAGAVENEMLDSIPTCEKVIRDAHVLAGKPGKHKPIMVKLASLELKSILFKNKKKHAPRLPGKKTVLGRDQTEPDGAGRARTGPEAEMREETRLGGYCFPMYEDLTRTTFQKMRAISQHEDVQSCWSINGQLRFKVKGSDEVRKVVSIFDTVEQMLQ